MKTTLNARSGEIPQKGGSAISDSEKVNQSGINLLFLGDSYTVGTGIDPEKSWPAQLQKKLVDSGYSLNNVKIVAGNGWSTKELKEQFLYFRSEKTFDLVTIQIGVNDQFRNRNIESYKADFAELIELVLNKVNNNSNNVVVISIPDYGHTPSGKVIGSQEIGEEIDKFNEVNRMIAVEKGVKYVDITSLSRESSNDPELVAPDGLHFSSKMYSNWTELILPTFIEKL